MNVPYECEKNVYSAGVGGSRLQMPILSSQLMVVSSTPLVSDYIISARCVHLGSLCLSVSPIGLWAPSGKGLSELVMNPSVRETQGEILLHHPRAQGTW